MNHHTLYSFLLASAVTVASHAQQKNLSLQDAVVLASKNNAQLRVGALEIQKSRQQRNLSRSVLLPSVTASGNVNHYFKRTPFFGFGEESAEGKIPYGRFGGDDQVSAAVTAVQPVFNPMGYASLQHSRLKERESEIALDRTEIDTYSLVKQTYLQILVLRERLELQEESIERNQRALKDAKSLFVQGKALRVDTLRASTAVKNLEPALLKLKHSAETVELQLKTLLGIDSAEEIVLTDSLFVDDSTIPGEDEVYDAARNNNPEYKLIDLREKIKVQEIEVASASRLPVLSAVGQYQLQTQTNSFEYRNAYYPSSSFIGLQVSIPIFSGLGTEARVKHARLEREQSKVTSAFLYEQLRATVHDHVSATKESAERLKTTLAVKETAELSYQIIQYRYKKGVASRLELTDSEFELSTAQSNYLEAVYDYLSSRIALARLMGKEN